jgi:PAS domain S-box-containing protein
MIRSIGKDSVSSSESETSLEGGGLYRLLVDSVQDYAIFALDPTGVVMTWNAGAQRLKGYKPEEIIGKHFSTFYSAPDIAAGKPEWELTTAMRDGRVEDEGWRLRKDGSRFWALVVLTALYDSQGNHVGFAKVTRDLTDRKRAEEELRISEERFRLLVQGVRDYAIFMLDPEGRVASWNDGAQRIKGYTAQEIIGRHIDTFYPAADVAARKTKMELDHASRYGSYEEEGWRVRKDGSCFWANVLITAIRNSDNKLIGFAKVTRDLTERRAAQERAIADARRIAETEAASRTKTEFLTAMSHELRTPINATLGYTDLMEMGVGGALTEQHQDYLTRIRGSQQYLLRIITDLLNYSRIEAGQVEYDVVALSVHDIVESVLPMVQPQAISKGITIRHGPCPAGLMGMADRTRGEQIVLNLLMNAVKFTPSGGTVTVGCGADDSTVFITVSDTGPGVPPEHQSDIFEPFVQVGRSLTSGHEGTGLGLAISRDLARAMGGDLSLRSQPGEGATFTLSLEPA